MVVKRDTDFTIMKANGLRAILCEQQALVSDNILSGARICVPRICFI